MRKLLYITSSDQNKEALSNCVSNEIEIDSLERHEAGIVKDQDVVLLDFNTGSNVEIDLLKRLRSESAYMDIPIVLVVDDPDTEFARKGLSKGASGLLTRPFTKDNVHKTLDTLCHSAENISPHETDNIVMFISATMHVLKTTAGFEVKRRRKFIKKDYQFCGELTASISMTGGINGTVSISMDELTARQMSASIAWMKPEELDEQMVQEGLGEIANQVAGRVRTMFFAKNLRMEISLPKVVCGYGQRALPSLDEPLHTILFEIGGSFIALHLCLREAAHSLVPA